MPLYPTYSPRITNTTFATIEYLNELQDNVKAIVQDFYYAKGTFTTLNSYLKQVLTTTGNVIVRHTQLTDVTASQHHDKYHARTHAILSQNPIDAIPNVTTTAKGLVGMDLSGKLYHIASKANRTQVATLSYNGNNVIAGQYFSLGFRPMHVMIFYDNDTDAGSTAFDGKFMAETIWGMSHSWRHQIDWTNDSGVEHRSKPVTSSVKITTYGIKVYGILNRSTAAGQAISKYHVLAYRAD